MERVLLVNDCRFESIIIKDILEDLGYAVYISNEFDALGDLTSYNPSILICNLIMKKTTGDKIILLAKERKPQLRCILSSSNNLNKEDYPSLKDDSIIKTPITRDKLEKVISLNKETNNENLSELKSIIESNRKKDRGFSFCPYCGEKLQGLFRFCPECGSKIVQ